MSNWKTYQIVLEKAREKLNIYEDIITNYPPNIKKIPDIKNPTCVWCVDGKRDNFTKKDINETCLYWCKFCVESKIKNSTSTGIEPDLLGPFLKDMIELNNYILTTASTNDPSNPECQAMFITFSAPPFLVDKLKLYLNSLDMYYNYMIFGGSSDGQFRYPEEEDSPISVGGDYFGDYGQHLNEFITHELVEMGICDNLQSRRTLYKVLLDYLSHLDYMSYKSEW